jgi:DNA-binding NarL/FixJ family response regulator
MKPLRILIADDHELVRKGLQNVLEQPPEWKICGEAPNGRKAVELAAALNPDIVVMDLSMPDLNGLEATRQICKLNPKAQVVVLSMFESDELVRQVLAAGGRGYVLKSDAAQMLVKAIESLAEGRTFFSEKVSEMVHHKSASVLPSRSLTAREREIIQFVAEGNSNKQVAALLKLSTKTVDAHRTNIMRKLNLHSIAGLVRYSIRNKIIEA